MNSLEASRYLARIGITGSDESSYEFLAAIQRNHLLNINFNNLHLIANKAMRWNWKDAFDGVVNHNGGGVCFELNNLLNQLLRALNFDVILVAAPHLQKLMGETVIDHVANLVTIEGCKYLVDVAGGYYSSRIPIPINGEIVEDANYAHRVINDENLFTLQNKRSRNEWRNRYTFTTDEKCVDEFRNFDNSVSENFFRANIFLVNFLENEIWFLIAKRLHNYSGHEMSCNDVDELDLKSTIREHFDSNEERNRFRFPSLNLT